MLKPGIYPPNEPRKTESHAELAVYKALSQQLPPGWYAWHSLRIRVPGHPDAEADFVIVDPKQGILILEVKGGQIEERDGIWHSNSSPLKHAPREQANRFLRELINLLHSKDTIPPPCGIATCFPDTEFSIAPDQGDLKSCVIGAQDLYWLDKALPDLMTCALAKGYKPKGKWLQAIHLLWGETWVPRIDLGLAARVQKDELLHLDTEQFDVLQGLTENQSVLVLGAAGTGKTVLALAMAQKLADDGKRVLMLCFTEPLAQWLTKQLDRKNVEIWAIKRYAVELIRQAGNEVVIKDTPEFWRDVSMEALVEALPKLRLSWDALVLDESQDLDESDWALVEELTGNKSRWAFMDPEQAFWPERKVPEELFGTRFRLGNPYRCPKSVQQLAGYYIGESRDSAGLQEALDQDVVAVRSCPGDGTVLERISNEIDRLKSSGLKLSDIAVISLRGAAEADSIVHRDRIGTHKLVRAHDPEASENVVGETFLRFKGLERPAIIITDVGLALCKSDYARRMYIALTRTLSVVRIIDSSASLLQDPILKRLLV